MTWIDVYLVCFWLGVLLSAVSWLFGVAHLHLPHGWHHHALPHAHTAAPHGHGGHAHAQHIGPSPYNFSTITAFLAWFGGAGFLLTQYVGVSPLAALLAAAVVGLSGAAVMFWFMAKVLWSPQENLDPDDYEMVGLLGTVSIPIRPGGTGEILFTQAGARAVAGARSEDGRAIGKGVEIVITRYENGLAFVRTWDELASERERS